MPQKHYTPPLTRFNVCALYHESKARGIPMTQLANDLVEAGLKDSPAWQKAQDQLREGAGINSYHINQTK